MDIRWDYEKVSNVTGKRQKAAQLRWFIQNFGIQPPCDALGVIMNDSTYDALLKKQCGILQISEPDKRSNKPRLRTDPDVSY